MLTPGINTRHQCSADGERIVDPAPQGGQWDGAGLLGGDCPWRRTSKVVMALTPKR